MRALNRVCRACNRTDKEIGSPVDPRDGLCWRTENTGYSGCYERFRAWAVVRYKANVLCNVGQFVDWRLPQAQVLFDKWLEEGRPEVTRGADPRSPAAQGRGVPR